MIWLDAVKWGGCCCMLVNWALAGRSGKPVLAIASVPSLARKFFARLGCMAAEGGWVGSEVAVRGKKRREGAGQGVRRAGGAGGGNADGSLDLEPRPSQLPRPKAEKQRAGEMLVTRAVGQQHLRHVRAPPGASRAKLLRLASAVLFP